MPRLPVIAVFAVLFLSEGALLPGQEPIPLATGPAPVHPRGVVFLVGGIGGFDFIGRVGATALPAAGVNHEIREFVWTHGRGHYLKDLQDSRYLLGKARELAAEILEIKSEDPARPVYLVGHSAGAALCLEARGTPASDHPRAGGAAFTRGGATFDLRPVLWATRGEVVSFNSGMDWFILGWGTFWFGTADRFYGPAAGMNGFEVARPTCLIDRELYQRFIQIAWKPEMLAQQYGGLHTSTSMPGFLALCCTMVEVIETLTRKGKSGSFGRTAASGSPVDWPILSGDSPTNREERIPR